MVGSDSPSPYQSNSWCILESQLQYAPNRSKDYMTEVALELELCFIGLEFKCGPLGSLRRRSKNED